MSPRPVLTRRRAIAQVAFIATVALACAALVSAAALVPAPPVVLPLLVIVCIGMPMAVAGDLPRAVRALRREAAAVAALRRYLASLPETKHPLER